MYRVRVLLHLKKCVVDVLILFKFLLTVCGNKLVKNPTTIIGGKKAFKGKYPWQVAVYGKINRKKNTFICGGALISERLIITGNGRLLSVYKNYIFVAAHCISNFDGQPSPPSDFTVAVGKYYRGLKDERDINNTQFSAVNYTFTNEAIFSQLKFLD